MKRICLFLLVLALLLGTVCPTIAEQSPSEAWDRIVKMQNEALSSTQTHDGKVDEENMVEINKIRIDGTDYNVKDSDARESIEQLSEENEKLSRNLASITAPKKVLVDVQFEEENGYVLPSHSGMPTPIDGDTYRVSNHVSVTPGEAIIVTAFADYGNLIYAFYDVNGIYISGEKSAADSVGTEIKDKLIIVPETASTIRIAIRSNHPRSIKRYGSDEVQIQKWQDKIWCVVGDSLTEKNSRTTKNYHDYIGDATGINVINMGLSGTGYANGASSNNAFYQRISNVPTNADVVTIFGSGNDMSSGLGLGTPTDTGTETLCGCINTTIDNLIAIMPAVSLGIVSPTPWVGSSPANADGGMAKYCAAMKTICENRSIPFLDLFHCSNLRPWTEEGRAACYTKDDGNGVHPDEKGHALIAPRFKAFLETLIL